MRTELPGLVRPTMGRILCSDRFPSTRRLFYEENGYFPLSCSVHLGWNAEKKVGASLWKDGGEDMFRRYACSSRFSTHVAALEEMKKPSSKFAPMLKYLTVSEEAQGVFTEKEMSAFPSLRPSFTLQALRNYCLATGASSSHHKAGHSPIQSSNNVERVNGQDVGIRCLGVLDFLIGKNEQITATLKGIQDTLTSCSSVLIPEVEKVWIETAKSATQLEVKSDGLDGFYVIEDVGLRTLTNVNIVKRTCNGTGVNCIRPSLTKEPCACLVTADIKSGATKEASYFNDKFPRWFITKEVLDVLKLPAMAFVPPNMSLLPPSELFSLRPPEVMRSSKQKPGKKTTNRRRFASCGLH